jgi:hypothetical protein
VTLRHRGTVWINGYQVSYRQGRRHQTQTSGMRLRLSTL